MSELEGLHFPIPTDQIPSGWELVRISQIASDIQTGFASGRHNSDGDGIPHLRPMNISADGKLDFSDGRFVDPAIDSLRLKRGDILFNNTNSPAWVGKTAFVDTDDELAFSNHMTRLRVFDGVDARFVARQLHFVCRAGYFEHQCKKHVNQASINREFLAESTPFVLPPTAEQQRIAEKLDSLLSRVDLCRERLDNVRTILKRFRQSVLAAATSGKLTKDWRDKNRVLHEWQRRPLSDLILGLEQGWSPKCENFPSKDSEHWGVIKTTAIQALRFDETENKQLPRALEPRPRFELQADDILITRAGPRVRCGVACHIPRVRPKLILCDKAYRFRAVESLVRPEYLATALNAPEVVTAIDKLKTGISESGMNLTQTKFMELEIPCPTLQEQNEILRLVKSLFVLADAVETHFREASSHIEQLVPTVLSKAFLGELVPQDPNDEPASVLLDQIRDRNQTQATEKSRKTPGQKVGPNRMKKITHETLSEYILELPETSFSFDELRQKVNGSYEDIKIAVFKLLEKNEIGLAQYFDETAKEMRFTRAAK
jgi:type I restriction enzyme S subunit